MYNSVHHTFVANTNCGPKQFSRMDFVCDILQMALLAYSHKICVIDVYCLLNCHVANIS